MSTATQARPEPGASPARSTGPRRGRLPVDPLRIGVAWIWISVIVLLPIAAIVGKSFDDGLGGFWSALTTKGALEALGITVWVSLVVALINVVLGTLIAWVLVRDDFPGKGLVNAIIDLPFALPTIVASIVLLSLYGPDSPVGLKLNATQPALVIALAFVTLPFVVRQVQPVLLELDHEVEEAAASLGASNAVILRRVILPTLAPAILSGAGLAFTRAIGEFGSVVLVGGNIPGKTQVASQYIQQQIEADDNTSASVVSVALLLIAFVMLFVMRYFGSRAAKREENAA
ncbi:sulfate ABC transporter permease subunit CysT [Tsukamurella soli]|uniref:Sulfate transport system permease protein CysT n=1 Tax=Tsukamurella soli TaxID=644556 RepID=A0ABP8JDM9_9ACTN